MFRFVAIVLALLAGTLFLGAYLAPNSLLSCGPTPSGTGECARVDAIVAVSGGDTEARTRSAVYLYKNGWADKLIFSGAAADTSGPSNAEVMRNFAVERGVPAEDILIDDLSKNTRENANETNAILRDNGIKTIILTTSPYHQRRASLEFERATLNEVKVLNSPAENDKHWPNFWWITPNGWWLALGELGKIIMIYTGVPV